MKISKAFLQKSYTDEELQAILQHLFRNKSLAPSSISQYATKIPQWIQYLPTKLPHTLHTLLNNPQQSLKALQETPKIKHSPANHHIYISAAVAFIKFILKDATLLAQWKEIEKANWKPLADHYDENKPTPLQEEKLISPKALEEIRSSLPKGTIERLLISFYTLIEPIRADYFATEILSSLSATPTEENYIVRDPVTNTAKLIVTDFKTKQKYEKIENTLSSELKEELEESLRLQPRKYLFTTPETPQQPFASRKLFSNWACRTLTRVLKQPMTLTALRHIYITSKIQSKTSPRELKEIAMKMGHSRDIQRIYEWTT